MTDGGRIGSDSRPTRTRLSGCDDRLSDSAKVDEPGKQIAGFERQIADLERQLA